MNTALETEKLTMPDFKDSKGKTRKVISINDANSGRLNKGGSDDFRAEVQRGDRAAMAEHTKLIAPERIFESRCDTCNHPFRDWIEMMLVRGIAYKTLGDRVSPKVSRKSLANHHREHMDLQDTALRAMLEREARMQGIDVEEGIEDLITKRSVLETMVRKGFEDVVNGVTTVEPRDLVQITKLLADMDTHSHQVGLDELRAQVQIFIQAIKDVCSAEEQNKIGQRVAQLRKREQISAPFERVMEQEEIQAVVIED
jgi:hypothetical protein